MTAARGIRLACLELQWPVPQPSASVVWEHLGALTIHQTAFLVATVRDKLAAEIAALTRTGRTGMTVASPARFVLMAQKTIIMLVAIKT